MAWMFAGTEHDMVVGIHFHLHNMIVPPPVCMMPMIPSIHPALAQLDDKLARTVKVDNRKAARTGSKASVNIPPHLPIIYFAGVGPHVSGSFKNKDQMFMGVGLGVHPLGGIGFVTIEGKPAVGMLCMSMSCMSCGPVEMMVPAMPNFLLIPTRMPTVLYGLLPLALDLLVLLIAMIENLLDWLLDKLPDGLLKDILNVAKDAFIASLEVFCEAMFESDPPKSFGEALSMAGKAFTYEFVDGMTELVTDKLCDAISGSLGPVGSVLWDFAGEDLFRGTIDAGKERIMNDLTNGDYGAYNDWKDAAKADEDTNPLGPVVSVCAVGADISNGWANDFGGPEGRLMSAGSPGEQNALYNNRGMDFAGHATNELIGMGTDTYIKDPLKDAMGLGENEDTGRPQVVDNLIPQNEYAFSSGGATGWNMRGENAAWNQEDPVDNERNNIIQNQNALDAAPIDNPAGPGAN